MRLGVFTAMVVEGRVFDGSGRKLPPVEAIEAIAQAGYEGIEWGIADSYALTPSVAERDAEQLRKLCHDRGLEIISIASGAAARDLNAVRRKLEIAARLKAPMLRVDLRPYDPTVSYHDQVEQNGADFAEALELAHSYKIKLLVEIHFGALCPSPSLAQRFLSRFDSNAAGAILDPGNMVVEGMENWRIAIEVLGKYLAHVHAKNLQWSWTNLDWKEHPTDREHWQWQFAALDRGLVDWSEVIAALQAGGYQGWLSLEDFSTRPVKQKLEEGRVILSRLLENPGSERGRRK